MHDNPSAESYLAHFIFLSRYVATQELLQVTTKGNIMLHMHKLFLLQVHFFYIQLYEGDYRLLMQEKL